MIDNWIASYNPQSPEDLYNAKREIIQEIALAGLHRARFFDKAVFYGGTALRILYGLDRYSEDLDFSLLEPNPDFTLEHYIPRIQTEFQLLGLDVNIALKHKKVITAVPSAFLKDHSSWVFIEIRDFKVNQIFPTIKIKIEVDRNPPLDFQVQQHLMSRPFNYMLPAMHISSLFAGKMHATLFRRWKNNVKGRDWFDLVWYINNGYAMDIDHFRSRAVASGNWPSGQPISKADILELLNKKIDQLDIQLAIDDIQRFISDPRQIEIWSTEFFHLIIQKLKLTKEISGVA